MIEKIVVGEGSREEMNEGKRQALQLSYMNSINSNAMGEIPSSCPSPCDRKLICRLDCFPSGAGFLSSCFVLSPTLF